MYCTFYKLYGHNFRERPQKKKLRVIRREVSTLSLILEFGVNFSQLSG